MIEEEKVNLLSFNNIANTFSEFVHGKYPDLFPIDADLMRKLFVKNRTIIHNDARFSNEAKSMFDNSGLFTSDNWNSGENLIRTFFVQLLQYASVQLNSTIIEGDNIVIIYSYEILDDQSYLAITIGNDFEFSATCDQYLITWYKSRGRTEKIYRNGKLITLNEYVDLCNLFFISNYTK